MPPTEDLSPCPFLFKHGGAACSAVNVMHMCTAFFKMFVFSHSGLLYKHGGLSGVGRNGIF